VLIITHDRSLIEMVADRLWLVNDGTVKTYNGSMDDYAKLVIERIKTATREDNPPAEKKASGQNSKEARKAAAALRSQIAPLKKKADDLEREIESLGNQIKLLELKLADPDIYVKHPDKVITKSKQKTKLETDLATLETQWLAAAQHYETAKTQAGL